MEFRVEDKSRNDLPEMKVDTPEVYKFFEGKHLDIRSRKLCDFFVYGKFRKCKIS